MALQNFQPMYLVADVADVWFLIDGERIPAHKCILAAKSDYYKTMFYGSLPETGEINMNEANISAESFKEFLKFFYSIKPNLTMQNIESVMNMAKLSMSDEIFTKCEDFLLSSTTIDVMCVFRMAFLYDTENLREGICMHAESILKSASRLEFPFEYFQMITQLDSFVHEEKDTFIACIDWAKAECIRSNLDPLNAENLRNQLHNLLHQIRFTSMTKQDAADCIALCPGLFTANELQEIICMVGHNDSYQPKQFNWMPRRLNLNYNKQRQLQFSRFCSWCGGVFCFRENSAQNIESLRFTCNRSVLLLGFSCGSWRRGNDLRINVRVQINEINADDDKNELYSKNLIAHFIPNPKLGCNYSEASISLNKIILLRPNYTYEISITFESSNQILLAGRLETKLRVDHDIVFHFNRNDFVTGLSISRLDNRTFFRKIVHNPKVWILATGLCTHIADYILGPCIGLPLIYNPLYYFSTAKVINRLICRSLAKYL